MIARGDKSWGGLVGYETARYLTEQEKKVTIIEMLDELTMDMEPISRPDP